jgi:hypothetical protein
MSPLMENDPGKQLRLPSRDAPYQHEVADFVLTPKERLRASPPRFP